MLPLRIAALFHDVGKPEMHYTDKDGVNHYPNHWMLAQVAFHKYKQFFMLSKEEIRLISNLIYDHDKPLVKNNFSFGSCKVCKKSFGAFCESIKSANFSSKLFNLSIFLGA